MNDRQNRKRRDIAGEITNRIIAAIEAGTPPWKQPWKSAFGSLRPLRNNGAPYRGVNILILWDRAGEMGFENPRWMTFRQAREHGAHVKKGERGVCVIYYGATTKEVESGDGGDAERTFRFLKSYPVFNVDQIEDLPPHFYAREGGDVARTPPPSQRRAFFERIGADVRHGGDRAFCHRGEDFIRMPPYGSFDDPERYFATLAHETAHWTGAPSRLDRKKGRRYGDEDYAYEELVAEIASAMFGAEIGLPPDHIEDHAAYVNAWLKALRNDKRCILKAAADAQRACEYMMTLACGHLPGAGYPAAAVQLECAGAAGVPA